MMSIVCLPRSLVWLAVCITYTILLCGPASCTPISYAAMDHGRRMGELQGDIQSLHPKLGRLSSSKSSGDSSPKEHTNAYEIYNDIYTSEMQPPPIVTREPEVITVGCRSGFLGRGGDCRSSFSTFMFTVTDLAKARKPTPHRMIPNPSLYSLFPSFSSTRRRTPSTPSRPQTQREWLSSYSGFSRGRALLEKRNRNRQSTSSPGASDKTTNTKAYTIPGQTKPYDFETNIPDTDD